MTIQISDAAASARETARTSTGQFGTQPAAEADIDLELDATLNPLGGGRVIMLTNPSELTQPIIDAAVTRAIGPVRVDDQDQGTTTRISYRDPVAGMVEVRHAPGFEAYPAISDEQGRNLRGTAAATVLTDEHLSPDEKRIAAAKLTEDDKALIAASKDRHPGELSVVEHSVRTLRAAGVGAELTPVGVDNPMRPSFRIAGGTPWSTTVTFAGSDAVAIEGMNGIQPIVGANTGSVPHPDTVRYHLAHQAEQRAFASHLGPAMTEFVRLGSIERQNADGVYEHPADPKTWADTEDATTTFRVNGTGDYSSDERLELARTESSYELRVASNWASGVPADTRRRMADERISGAGVNPDKLCRAMIAGERSWSEFKEHDPYRLGD